MPEIESPFLAPSKSVAEITAESNETSLRLLLGIYKRCKKTLTTLERVAQDSSLHLAWTMKVRTSREEYLSFAQSVGIADENAQKAVEGVDLETSV